MKMQRLLVLDGEQRSTLAVVRSLGLRGLSVVVGSTNTPSLAGCSRYCSKQVCYSDPLEYPCDFCDDLIQIIEKERVQWLLPMTDASMNSVLQNSARFAEKVALLCETKDKYDKASNKINLMEFAQDIGVPVPVSQVFSNHDEITSQIDRIQYPVVLKPMASILQLENKFIKTTVRIVENKEELKQVLKDNAAFTQPFLAQEKVHGQGMGIFALCHNGEPLAVFSHRRLREKPPWGGVSVLCESTSPDPDAEAYACKLLKALNWNGVAMVEFKYDDKNKKHYLMEINARFWGSLQLAIDAGIDFPYLLYQIHQNNDIIDGVTLKYARMRWLLGDLDSLYLTLKYPKKVKPLRWQRGLAQFIGEFFKGSKFQNIRKDDIRPFLHEAKLYLKAL
ncbi:MAG: ATP-grasp domain-containing protein [Desulfobacteraceae bacterium]|jgi:predicted ATP-grasp superfamily ATP-dependent carboligase